MTWYHEGSDELQLARYWIAQYSLPRLVEYSMYLRKGNMILFLELKNEFKN